MKNEQFEKMDAFVKSNIPELKKNIPPLKSPNSAKGLILAPLLALGLAGVVTLTVVKKQTADDETTLALSETLEWDLTADDMPSEFEEVIAFAE